jgi:uncharacterized protein YndB with AHSA1/START domain
MSDLVERVARAFMRAEPWSSFWGKDDAEKLARAAIAVCMEEAAKVAGKCDDGSSSEGALTAYHIAAAIRALVKT